MKRNRAPRCSLRSPWFALLAAALMAAASSFLGATLSVHADEPSSLPPGVKKNEKGKLVSTFDGVELAFVPSGAFTMGCDPADSAREDMESVPDHERATGAFFIEVLEVTNARYAKFLAAIAEKGHGTCPEEEPREKDHKPLDWGTEMYPRRSPGDDYPVVGVDWHDARAFAAWCGKRLPTEVEWEKACRGTDARPLPWGDSWPESKGVHGVASKDEKGIFRANWRGDADGYLYAAPVGKFAEGKSAYGCLDMGGNAWEWTESAFTLYPGHYETLDPKYPKEEQEKLRIYRGGSYNFGTMDLQTTHRHWARPNKKDPDMGIRCVVSAN